MCVCVYIAWLERAAAAGSLEARTELGARLVCHPTSQLPISFSHTHSLSLSLSLPHTLTHSHSLTLRAWSTPEQFAPNRQPPTLNTQPLPSDPSTLNPNPPGGCGVRG